MSILLKNAAQEIQLNTVRHLLHVAPVEFSTNSIERHHGHEGMGFVSAPLGHKLPHLISSGKHNTWFYFSDGSESDEDDLPEVFGTGDTEFEALYDAATTAGMIDWRDWESFLPAPTPADVDKETRNRRRAEDLMRKNRFALEDVIDLLRRRHGLKVD